MPRNLTGATFAPGDIGWLDFETRSSTDIKSGTYRYATGADTRALVAAYVIGDATPKTVASWRGLTWGDMPAEFKAHHARVIEGQAIWAAWNAGFDKAIWNFATDFPGLEPEHIIDVMAQATAAGLPPDLSQAAVQAGAVKKIAEGRELIALFCTPNGYKGVCGTPGSRPKAWQDFLAYAAGDIEAMRGVFKRTRQLPIEEWQEYWAMERVNERGVFIDERMVKAAAALAAEDRDRSRDEIRRLTGGVVETVDQVAKLGAWLRNCLPPEGREILQKRAEEIDEDGVVTRPAMFTLTRRQVERLIALLGTMPANSKHYRAMLRALQIRLYGGSKTPTKFGKMLDQAVDGVLHGQYVFNGAAQTGRASSRGVQIHNLARDTLPYEHEAIEALLGGAKYDDFLPLGDDSPVSRKLSLLIRPAFVPGGTDRMFVWSDWSQIEARILPWLAGNQARLDIFRAVDQDKNVPDIYVRSAADISHIPIEAVTKPIRQRGKVAELALGFGGGVNALQNMAAGYGMHLDDDEARVIVNRWREANQWCVQFWSDLMEAVDRALLAPRSIQQVGRIHYTYRDDYLDGSLLCVLPSGRMLTYRQIRYEQVEELDEDDVPTGKFNRKLRFNRGYGRVALWHGMFCENVVQAVAADCLRGTLVRLEQEGFYTRIHTHDEILVECADSNVKYIAKRLAEAMQRGFDWSDGLPLMSEETISPYYTKQEA